MPLSAAGLEPLVAHEPVTSGEAVPVVCSACSALGGLSTGDVGKWHLGSDPESRSPVDFGFDWAAWSPRSADEVLSTLEPYFPDGRITAARWHSHWPSRLR